MPAPKPGPPARQPPQSHLIAEKILLIRGQRVLLDRDLAALYEVETRALLQGVKRNLDRFPPDFMFQLTNQELAILRSQFVISSWGGRRYAPYAFTEQGVAMLSSVLNSLALEKRYDAQFRIVFDAIRELMAPKPRDAKPIGFVIPKDG